MENINEDVKTQEPYELGTRQQLAKILIGTAVAFVASELAERAFTTLVEYRHGKESSED